MKRVLMSLLGGILLLSACGGTPQVVQSTPNPRVNQPTATASSIPTSTKTVIPTETPTPSITPLPTIPTFTPTFDVSRIVTVTPAPKTECPNTNLGITSYQLNFEFYPSGNKYVRDGTIDRIMEFLNSGGKIDSLTPILSDIKANFSYQVITNDNIRDLILVSGSLFQSLSIIYCFNRHYIRFPTEGDEWGALFGDQIQFDVQDLNRNDIQDVLTLDTTPAGLIVKVWEWNGQSFMDLTPSNAFTEHVIVTTAKAIDLNNDGISELLLGGTLVDSVYPGQPLRAETSIFYWDGKVFSPTMSFGNPEYRFQAMQDGDSLTIQGKYSEARRFYQATISSKTLDWWSKERFEHNRDAVINFTTPSALTPDETEYPHLAAYAYYRIMLLHIVEGHESDADTVYKTLQQKFGDNRYGRPYVEMATAFWDAYQSSHKMYDGCAAAIQYAVEHPEILTPLGSDYHGSQSHIYIPVDVCPFR